MMRGVRSPEGGGLPTQGLHPAAQKRPNNGMHPTADTRAVINLGGVARRVMPAFGRSDSSNSRRRLAGGHGARLTSNTAPDCCRRAALRIIISVAWREVRGSGYRGWREVRAVSMTRPNKPMHPTADTNDVMLGERLGAAGDGRR